MRRGPEAGLSAAGAGRDGRVLKLPSTAAAGFPGSRGAMAAAGPGPGPGAGGKVKTLALVLQDEARRGGYCSGDTVSGQVLLELAGPLPLRGLRLEAAGRARVAWSEAAGTVSAAGGCGAEAAAGPRREAEVRYLDVRQSLLRHTAEGEGDGGVGQRCGAAAGGPGGDPAWHRQRGCRSRVLTARQDAPCPLRPRERRAGSTARSFPFLFRSHRRRAL